MSVSLSEILSWTGGRLVNGGLLGPSADTIRVERPAPLSASRANDLAFFFSKDYQHELATARPGILITGEPFVGPLEKAGLPFWGSSAVIACADPYSAMALLSEKFAQRNSTVAHRGPRKARTLHPTAVIHPGAELGEGVQVGAYCVVEEGARIGAGTYLYPGCFVGPRVKIGEDCVLFPRVSVYEFAEIGNRVRIHAGSVLGSDGFGYAPKREGKQVVDHQKIFHLGRVIIGDDVEIGANSCVDRGTIADTIIGSKSKLDNLVHIGHNARLDEGSIICGGTCLAGNSSTGKFAYVGGLTGIANHVHVGDGAMVGAVSLITKDVPPGETALGNPQREYKEHFRVHAALNRLIKDRSKGKGGESGK